MRAGASLGTCVAACLSVLVLSAAPALASRGHVFSGTFGEEGSGPGQLFEPMGVAVNEGTGDVYVADFGNNRVQWFSYNATSKAYEVAGQITAATGSGTGTVTEGSEVVESVAKTSGDFVPGQTVTGGGIPAETTITEVNLVEGKLKLSKPVEETTPGGKEARPLVALNASQAIVEPKGIVVDNGPASASREDVYIDVNVNETYEAIDKFTSSGEFVGQIAGTWNSEHTEFSLFTFIAGIAVDPHGGLWVADDGKLHVEHFTDAVTNEFAGFCEEPNFNFLAGGLTVNVAGQFYGRHGGEAVYEFNEDCKVQSESFGGESAAAQAGVTWFGVAAEVPSGDVYIDNVESIGRFTGSGVEAERFGSKDLASEPCDGSVRITCLGGIAVNGSASGATAGDVYAAVGRKARIVVFAPEPAAAPRVESESVTKLTDNSATLQAEVNPRSLGGEAETKYFFEYGPCTGAPSTCHESSEWTPLGGGSLPASFEVDSVSAPLEGLQPDTTYHFRLVASNGHTPPSEPVRGPERVFTTRNAAEFKLADGREWEMVSPAAMHGALVSPLSAPCGTSLGGPIQAGAQGGVVSYLANAPTEGEAAGSAVCSQVFSRRTGAGWSSRDIAVPHSVSTGVSSLQEVKLFSEDLSLAAVQPLGSFVPLAEDASEQTPYLRDNTTGAYTPLVTGCPGESQPCRPAVEENADVAPGTVFGTHVTSYGSQIGSCPPQRQACGPLFVNATPDFKHVILASTAGLKRGATDEEGKISLYEWSADKPPAEQLELVSLVPTGAPGGEERPAEESRLGVFSVSNDERGAISADGSHVFFTAEAHLYMRDMVAKKTIRIDLPEEGCESCGGGVERPEFQFASPDGSRVFFADKQKLTSDGGEYSSAVNERDLYVCEIHEDACSLKDLAPEGGVLGEVNVNSDGSWVYFAANSALAPGAVSSGKCTDGNAGGTFALSAVCDLYVVHRNAVGWGSPGLVAPVSGGDALDWATALTFMVARVSPNGRWFAFMSERSLTGYDNRDAVSGRPDQEVYLYDAQSERLTCASCDPTGARPVGAEYGQQDVTRPLLGYQEFKPSVWLAGSVPGWVQIRQSEALYQPRYLSDSGRLFFDAYDSLVSKDVNGTGDVYEFEPEGETVPGSDHVCSSGSTSGGSLYRPAHPFEVEVDGVTEKGEEAAGCVALMSSGSSSEESAFMDASETGGDVYFLSYARLSPLDVEGGRTVYDAHECTSASPCIAPPPVASPPCSTEASCRPAPSPQPSIFGAAGSATFSGPGNPVAPSGSSAKPRGLTRAQKLARALKACRRMRKRAKRQRCERTARKRYGARKASARGRRASDYRRAGR